MKGRPPVSPTRAMGIAIRLGRIEALAAWVPAQQLAYRLQEALCGREALERRDLVRLDRWVRVWGALRPELREFLVEALQDAIREESEYEEAVLNRALWNHLEGYALNEHDPGTLHRIWSESRGAEPDFSLIAPTIPRS